MLSFIGWAFIIFVVAGLAWRLFVFFVRRLINRA